MTSPPKAASTLSRKNAGSTTEISPMNTFDYFKYAWRHIQPFFTDAKVRYAVWQIWFNRDYTAWGILKNNPAAYSLKDWGVSNRLHTYFRKDITTQLWPLGAAAQPPVQPVDPYEGITSPVTPDQVLGTSGSEAGPVRFAAADRPGPRWQPVRGRFAQPPHPAHRCGWDGAAGVGLVCGRCPGGCAWRDLQRTVGSGGGSGWERVRGRHLELPHPEVHGGGTVRQDVGDGAGASGRMVSMDRAGWRWTGRGGCLWRIRATSAS